MSNDDKETLIELLEEWMYEDDDADKTMSVLSLIEEIRDSIK